MKMQRLSDCLFSVVLVVLFRAFESFEIRERESCREHVSITNAEKQLAESQLETSSVNFIIRILNGIMRFRNGNEFMRCIERFLSTNG